MLRWLQDRLMARRVTQLQQLTQQAREMDELLAFGRLSVTTARAAQARRDEVQQRARELMFG